MTAISNISDALARLDSTSLRFRSKTRDAVANGCVIAKAYEQISAGDRVQCGHLVSPEIGAKLLAVSGFMAEAAINERNTSLIRLALVLHLIEDFKKDYRENFRFLVLISYASKQLGAVLTPAIEDVIRFGSGRAIAYLGAFGARDESLNTLESVGIRAEVVGGEIRFVSA